MNELLIRPVCTEDTESIVRVYNSNPAFCMAHLGQEKVDAAFVLREQEEMQRVGFRSCVITEEERVIGVMDYKDDEPAYLSLMMLDKPFQGSGRGSACFRMLEEKLYALGRKSIRLDVVDSYPGNALCFWQKHGFEITGSTELEWNTVRNQAKILIKK